MKGFGVWWTNRTTATLVAANSAAEARSKALAKKKQGYGSIRGVRVLEGADAAKARRGEWVRTRFSGKSPAQSSEKSKYRSWLH